MDGIRALAKEMQRSGVAPEFADSFVQSAETANAGYRAGLAAAAGESARRLRALIVHIEKIADWLERGGAEATHEIRDRAADQLRAALVEAREP